MHLASKILSKAELQRLGIFVLGGPLENETARKRCADMGIALKAANENAASVGGYLVPEEIGPVLRKLLDPYGILRRYAQRTTMTGDTKTHPRRTGAATVYFPSEGTPPAESDIGWDVITLTAHKATALFRASLEIEEDAAEFGAEVADEFGRAMAGAEDTIGFAGDGGGNSMGVHGIVTVLADGAHAGGVAAAAGHDTFAEIDAADLTNLMAKLPPRAVPGAAWYVVAARGCTFALSPRGNDRRDLRRERRAAFRRFPIRVTATLATSGDNADRQSDAHFSAISRWPQFSPTGNNFRSSAPTRARPSTPTRCC